MQTAFWGLLGIVAGGALAYFAFGRKKGLSAEAEREERTGMSMLLQQMNELQRTVDQKLHESSTAMHESMQRQAGESVRIIRDITEELVKVGEGQKQVASFADQLRDLQNILKNPKQRGVL